MKTKLTILTALCLLLSSRGASALTYQEIYQAQSQGQVLGAATPALIANTSTYTTSGPLNTTGATLLVGTVYGASTTGLSDSLGNSWTPTTQYGNAADGYIQTYYVCSPIVSSTDTFTNNAGGGQTIVTISAWSGTAASLCLDGQNGATSGGGTSIQPGSITPSSSGELIISNAERWSGGLSPQFTVDSGLSILDQPTSYTPVSADAYLVDGSTSAINPSWNATNNNFMTANSLAFKAASGSGTDTQPPTVPTNLSATAVSSSAVNLSWTASTDNVGVTGYTIYRNGSLLTTVNYPLTTFSDTGLTAGATYTYTVNAYDAAGNHSSQSTSASATTQAAGDTTPPSTPTNLTATAISSSQINLSWTASTDNVGVTGYKIYRGGSQVGTSATNSYSDSGLAASTAYTYTVSAYDAAGNNSSQSTSASATTQASSGGSTITAKTCSSTDVQNAINSASNGATVVVPSGSCTWSSQVTVASGITLQGQTVCSGTGDPNGGTNGVISCVDNTNVTLSIPGALTVDVPSGQFVTVTGFTFIGTAAVNAGVGLQGNHGQVSFRFHHNHMEMMVSDAQTVFAHNGYGLIDHNYFQDEVSSGAGAVPLDFGGDLTTLGYQNWNDPTQYGTNQAIYAEDNYYTTSHINTEGFFDAYYGAKMVVRYNTIVGNELGGWHGTDSGFPFRSPVYGEIYGNSITNAAGTYGIYDMRGGSTFFWNNVVSGANSGGITLEYYRYGEQNPYSSDWGSAQAGLNWIIPDVTFWNDWPNKPLTLNAPDFAASHAYPALAAVGPVSNNPGAFNFQLTNGPCTSGSYPASWNQTWGSSTTDSNGCVWQNVGGSTAPSGLTVHGWCAANPDTIASSDATCSALSPGDTASRYFDTNGGVYPYRDQPGRAHNQVLAPNYEWGNSGSALPGTVFVTDAPPIIVANRDYYNHTASFNGSSGTGTGLLSARPSSCTTGVAYWATDTNTLYQCSSTNTWAVYYTPYVYPDPLDTTTGGGTDTTPPATPQNLSATAISSSQINLSWTASTDNVGVTGYTIYRNGSLLTTVNYPLTAFSDTGLSAGTTYTYTVDAYDAANNHSSQSTSASATTSLNPDTTPPTVNITSPSSGTVSGSITFSASASDPAITGQVTSGLKLVTLSVDGYIFATSTSASVSSSLNTQTLTNTTHTLTASALDNAGNSSTPVSVNITVNNSPATKYPRLITLSSLEGIPTIPSSTLITATILSPSSGAVLETQTNLIASNGKYTITFLSIDPQLVNIRVKVNGYLSQLLTNIDTTINSPSALSVPQLSAGDFNNDNIVNSLDYSLMNGHWLTNYPSADINADGLINSLDFAILKNNFNKSGQ